jgi:NAD(P)H-hydrate repair Nnr-like enzyme with NAD(P)H-hydrate dehydratase domain
MSAPVPLDHDWRAAHPLPAIADADKYGRGRVLTVGGSRRVPGAIGLAGEAAFRVGAGKVRIATVESAALGLGLAIPEAGMVALPETDEGEISARGAGLLREQIGSCDTLVFGPAMARTDDIGPLVGEVLAQPRTGLTLVVDAAAMAVCVDRPD